MSAYDVLTARGVTRLCHFTLLKSLTHIMASVDGVLASSSIRKDTKTATDTARHDGELDHVCCSVQYPNSWFWEKARQNNFDKIFKDWVVLYIDLCILNSSDAKFCPCNASKGRGIYINDNMEELDSIFATSVPTFSCQRSPQMLASCPTDGQAEILIKDSVPREYIIGIATCNEDVAKQVDGMLKMFDIEIPIYVAPDVITPNWNNMIRNGLKPEEKKCVWPKED